MLPLDPALRSVGLKPVSLLMPPTLHRGTSAFPKCSGMFQDAFLEAWFPSGVVSALKVSGPADTGLWDWGVCGWGCGSSCHGDLSVSTEPRLELRPHLVAKRSALAHSPD